MATIEAHEKNLAEIFNPALLFEIPGYQRPYAWTEEQAGQLLSDLVDWCESEPGSIAEMTPYFLGSIVLVKGESPKAEVVDGQQRLTTLVLLFAAAKRRLPGLAESVTDCIKDRGNKLRGTTDRYRLLPRERDREFFESKLMADGANWQAIDEVTLSSDSQRNMLRNSRHLEAALRELDDAKVERLLIATIQRCFLVMVTTEDLESAYRIFSVLNDRGLDLAPTDILKAKLLGDLPEAQRAAYTRKWEEREESLGREDFAELFSHIRMIHKKAKLRNLIKELRDEVISRFQPGQFIDQQVLPYAEALATLRDASYSASRGADEVNGVLRHLSLVDNADWLPCAMSFFVLRSKDDGLLAFLEDLERLAASMMIRRSNVNQRIERYGRVLTAIEQETDLFGDTSPLQLTPAERGQTLEALDGDIYSQLKVRRPLLLRLDTLLSDSGVVHYDHGLVTVEHVLPQNPRPASEWLRWFPNEEERLRWTNRLANLVLLTRRKNSAAGNLEFARKKKEYFSRDLVVSFVLTSQVVNESTWTPAVLDLRQRALVGRLKEAWRL